MLAYAARRLVAIPPTLFIIVTLAFAVVRAAPGGPFDAEQSLPPQVKANLERAYGLDQPLRRSTCAICARSRTATSGRR
jgi:oligopeptide transport system permease protein